MIDVVKPNKPTGTDAFRTGKAYTIAQAARLAGTSPATVRRWLAGYEAPGHQMMPVFAGQEAGRASAPLVISFLELVEIVVVARFRKGSPGGQPVTLERIRRAHAYSREQFQLPYPFASLNLRESGGHILHQFEAQEPGPALLALDMGGQWVLPGLVREELDRFEFSDRLVSRWFPLGKQVPIVVDPHIAAGRPTIAGSGVTVEIIRKRFQFGQSIDFIARDFELRRSDVEQALRYAAAAA